MIGACSTHNSQRAFGGTPMPPSWASASSGLWRSRRIWKD